MNIQQMMKQAQQMQERLKQQMAELRVEASAGGGMVTVVVNGAKQIQSLRIDPEVVSKDDVEMLALPDPLIRLIEELQRLPGIGPKGAQRLAFHILKTPREQTDRLVEAVREVKDRVTHCSVCHNITDADPCAFCRSDTRDHHVICVVEEPQNVSAIERTREFKGVYHVLMGALSPLQGIGPDELKIKSLLARIGNGVNEVILATNPNVEGEATAIYLARLLKPLGVRVTRIATGVPVGSDLEYADDITIHKALEGRREV
jgi:recombination protein RecR